MRVTVDHDLPMPRVIALLSPDCERTTLTLGVELSSRYGEPVVRVELELRWLRPRPWRCEVIWPARLGNRFEWRSHAR